MNSCPKHILITGVAGYLGSRLANILLIQGYYVTGVDSFIHHNENSINYLFIHDRFQFIECDVCDCKKFDKSVLCGRSYDVIYPLAAYVGAPLCERHETLSTMVNRDQLIPIIAYQNANPGCMIIYPNTNSGYGSQDDSTTHCTEETPLTPLSHYGRVKSEAEFLILKKCSNYTILRLATVFGLSNRFRTDLLVNSFVWYAVRERCITVFQGYMMRNYIGIEDICRGFMWPFLNREKCQNQVFNLGDDRLNMDKLHLAQRVAQVIGNHLGFEVTVIQKEYASDQDNRNYIVSSKKICNTGFRCECDFDKELVKMAHAFNIKGKNFHKNY